MTSLITGAMLSLFAADSHAENSDTVIPTIKNDSAKKAHANGTSIKTPVEEQNQETLTVTAPRIEQKAGTQATLSAAELQKNGATDFGTIMRYQPLVGATGVSGGSGAGKSGFDRGGYTGYNIRGLESNRVGIDVDGIAQPNATSRGYVGRPGLNTFGIGRDYIDPYMYGHVDIQSGATAVSSGNTSMGGAVSFRPKSPDDYLSPARRTYFGYQSDYDSSNRGWHNGITAAGGDETLRGIFVYSRRDGQETRNNSGTLDAYPANWHPDAFMTSGIWQPNDEHKLTGTLDYYDKTNHTHYDGWNAAGTAIIGTTDQTSQTRRWGVSLKDDWTPFNEVIDSLSAKVYYQHTEAHDWTAMPETASSMETVYSNYDTDTVGFDNGLAKSLGRHDLSAGVNASLTTTKRPFSQEPAPSAYNIIMQPQADSQTTVLGAYVQDHINIDLGGRNFAIIPGVRVAHQTTKPQDLSSLASGSTVLSESELETLYGKSNADTQVLPSLIVQYDLTPRLLTYLQYKRGAQFPNSSQLYSSWNLGSSYAGSSQYALIGNPDLKTETSDNLEWGIKGDVADGITLHSAVFYNTYKNFIAYNRYTRSGNPDAFTQVPSNIYTIYEAENRDKAYIYGGETSVRFNVGTWFDEVDGLSATLAFGYNEGKSKSSYLGDRYVDIDSVAPMKAIVGVAWDDPAKRYGTALTATFVHGKRATYTNRETYSNTGAAITDASTEYMNVPGYGLLDWTGYWRVANHVTLSGGVYNITDRKYWDYLSSRNLTESTPQDAYNKALAVMPGRTFQLGMNIDF